MTGVEARPQPRTFAFVAGEHSVPYLLGGSQAFRRAAAELTPDRWFVIAGDHPAVSAAAARVAGELAGSAPVTHLVLRDEESAKSLDAVAAVGRQLVAEGASRASVVVAVGGGNVSNVAGLCAALLFRGIRLVQVPTTLIGMSDVVLSLKQGVNFAGIKNGLGTYYPPSLIWADPELLGSLPHRQIRAGLAEIVKNALIIAPEQIEVLRRTLRPRADYTIAELAAFIELAVVAKARVLADDARERGVALTLEYGHTIGHALEILSGGRLGHGQGVAFGMRVAARVSFARGRLNAAGVDLHDHLIAATGLDLQLPADLDRDAEPTTLIEQVLRDNKRGYLPGTGPVVPMVLLTRPGVADTTAGLPIVAVSPGAVLAGFTAAFGTR